MKFLKNLFKREKPQVDSDVFAGNKIIEVEDMNVGDRVTTLIDYALTNNLTILVGNQAKIDVFKKRSQEVKIVGFAKNFTKHLKDLDLSSGVLIDESIAPEMIEYLSLNFDVKICGGYKRKG